MFLPLLPSAVTKMTSFIDEVCHNPEPLEIAVRCLSTMFQNLSKFLTSKIPWVLQMTKSLRTHRVPHIRKLAAQSVAYLFRQASPRRLRAGVTSLLAESCTRQPKAQIVDGVGQTLASICIGIQGNLNSLAQVALETALDSNLLCLEQFTTSDKKKRSRDSELDQSFAPTWLTMDIIRSRCSDSIITAFITLGVHVTQGESQSLMLGIVMRECNTRMDRYLEARSSMGNPPTNDRKDLKFASQELGQCASLAAILLESIKKSKAIDLDETVSFASRLTDALLWGREVSCTENDDFEPVQLVESLKNEVRSLADYTLELHSALIARLQAKKAIPILEETIPSWSRILSLVTRVNFFAFTRRLLLRSNSKLLHLFASELVAVLCDIVGQHETTPDTPEAVEALLLVCEVAQTYRLEIGMFVPRLMVGCKSLVNHIVELLKKWESPPSTPLSKQDVGVAWLGLRCLHELASKSIPVAEMCRKVASTIEMISAQDVPGKYVEEDVSLRYLLLILSRAKWIMGESLREYSELEFVEQVAEVTRWLKENCDEYCVLKVAAEMFGLLRQAVDNGECHMGLELITANALEKLLPTICPQLSNPSQKIRRAALMVICSFEPPVLLPPDDSEGQVSLCENR